jgi:hypothetical protein
MQRTYSVLVERCMVRLRKAECTIRYKRSRGIPESAGQVYSDLARSPRMGGPRGKEENNDKHGKLTQRSSSGEFKQKIAVCVRGSEA